MVIEETKGVVTEVVTMVTGETEGVMTEVVTMETEETKGKVTGASQRQPDKTEQTGQQNILNSDQPFNDFIMDFK